MTLLTRPGSRSANSRASRAAERRLPGRTLWAALRRTIEYIHEKQDYIGSPTLSSLPGDPLFEQDPGREDEIDVARFRAAYSPREFIELDLTLAYTDRSSNRPSRIYDARAAGFGIRVVF